MRMTVALVVAGVLLLLSSFYFGLKFFDGKVEKDTYGAALRYDKQNRLISQYGIAPEIGSLVYDGTSVKIEGILKSTGKIKINSIKLESPSTRMMIKQSSDIKDEKFMLAVNQLVEGNYVIIFDLMVDNENIRLEKPIYIKK